MDQEIRTRVVSKVVEKFTRDDDEREHLRADVEGALQLLPNILGARVRAADKPEATVLFDLVTEARLFIGRVTRESPGASRVNVQLKGHRFDDGMVDVEMTQHGHERTWIFWPGVPEEVRVDGQAPAPGAGPDDDELFSRALARRLGWSSPDVT
jgi:hypothetical protein